MKHKQILIAEGEHGECGAQALRWSGLEELWEEFALDNHFNFLDYVVKDAMNSKVENTYDDSNMPLNEFDWWEVYTSQPDKLRLELCQLTARLINSKRELLDHELLDITGEKEFEKVLIEYIQIKRDTGEYSQPADGDVSSINCFINQASSNNASIVDIVMRKHNMTREEALEAIEAFGG